jgi:hypothetical protein
MRNAYKILKNLKERAMGVDERIQLKWVLHKPTVMTRTGIVCLRMGIKGGLL